MLFAHSHILPANSGAAVHKSWLRGSRELLGGRWCGLWKLWSQPASLGCLCTSAVILLLPSGWFGEIFLCARTAISSPSSPRLSRHREQSLPETVWMSPINLLYFPSLLPCCPLLVLVSDTAGFSKARRSCSWVFPLLQCCIFLYVPVWKRLATVEFYCSIFRLGDLNHNSFSFSKVYPFLFFYDSCVQKNPEKRANGSRM